MDNDELRKALFVLGVILLVLATPIFLVYKSISATGEIEYCYTQYFSPPGMNPQYTLRGFRPWREDRHIAAFQSLEDALAAAEKMHCRIGTKGVENGR
jgi:hypothetical protein